MNFGQLLITRFLFGAGEAGAYPNLSGVIARWFAAAERARAQGFVWAASRLGGALSPILVVPLLRAFGWRSTFLILGATGFVWVIAWRFGYPKSEKLPVSCQARRVIPWALVAKNRQVWLIFIMYWCYAWGSWFYMGWFPTYLVRAAGFTESEMGIFASFPFFLGVLGNLIGGFASDRLVTKYGLKLGRRAVACSSLVVSAILILIMALSINKRIIIVVSSLGFGVMDLMLPASWAVCLDIGREYSGVVSGVMNSAGQLGGFFCTVLVGYILRASGSYKVSLCIISGMVMVSAILFSRIDPTKPITSGAPGESAVLP